MADKNRLYVWEEWRGDSTGELCYAPGPNGDVYAMDTNNPEDISKAIEEVRELMGKGLAISIGQTPEGIPAPLFEHGQEFSELRSSLD